MNRTYLFFKVEVEHEKDDNPQQLGDEICRRDAGEDRHHREQQEAERDGRGREHARASERAPDQCRTGRKPAVRSFSCARLVRSR